MKSSIWIVKRSYAKKKKIMPELRKDPIHGMWVIISTERSRRPSDLCQRSEDPVADSVLSVKEMRIETPPEIIAYRDNGTPPNSPGWSLRVVPNKFPALASKETWPEKAKGFTTR